MLPAWLLVVTFIAALGAALIGGVFFAFSFFVMTALGRLPPPQGITAMQSINIVAVTPVFMAALFGTGLLCAVLAVASFTVWQVPGAGWLLLGSLIYLGGVIAVTMVCNVPLNNRLAAADPESGEGAILWARYLTAWTAWNHVRTAAGLAASAAFILAFV